MSSPGKRRVFFAAQPNLAERNALAENCKGLVTDDASRLRWLDADGWHVTLRFVGDVEAGLVPRLLQYIAPIEPFTIELSAVEPFPSARRPLVIAATGAAEDAGHALVQMLEANCRAVGLRAEKRPWRPHLSLARVRGRKPMVVEPLSLSMTMKVDSFVLMESVAGERGNRYLPVHND